MNNLEAWALMNDIQVLALLLGMTLAVIAVTIFVAAWHFSGPLGKHYRRRHRPLERQEPSIGDTK